MKAGVGLDKSGPLPRVRPPQGLRMAVPRSKTESSDDPASPLRSVHTGELEAGSQGMFVPFSSDTRSQEAEATRMPHWWMHGWKHGPRIQRRSIQPQKGKKKKKREI